MHWFHIFAIVVAWSSMVTWCASTSCESQTCKSLFLPSPLVRITGSARCANMLNDTASSSHDTPISFSKGPCGSVGHSSVVIQCSIRSASSSPHEKCLNHSCSVGQTSCCVSAGRQKQGLHNKMHILFSFIWNDHGFLPGHLLYHFTTRLKKLYMKAHD